MSILNYRRRDPLLDSNIEAAIERRFKELIGLGLIALGVVIVLMIGSFTPDDPNWMVSSDVSARNFLGRFGASVAAFLLLVIGWGTWGLAVVCVTWGIRFLLHLGEERSIGRLIFSPIAIALLAMFSSSVPPTDSWVSVHSFGLGGLFGDTITGLLLTLLPLQTSWAMSLFSIILLFALIAVSGFVLGFTRSEIKIIQRHAMDILVIGYIGLVSLARFIVENSVHTTRQRNYQDAERQDHLEETVASRENTGNVETKARFYDRRVDPLVIRPEPPLSGPEMRIGGGPLMALKDPVVCVDTKENVADVLADDSAQLSEQERIRLKISQAIQSRETPSDGESPPDSRLLSERRRGPEPLIYRPGISDQNGSTNDMAADVDAVELNPEPPLSRQGQLFDTTAMAAPRPLTPSVVLSKARKADAISKRAKAEAQPSLSFEEETAVFELPPLALLENPVEIQNTYLSNEALEENARMLENVLDDYGVKGEIVSVRPGPVVTMYELEPAPGLKASRVMGLADDIARSMSALSARVSTVPGRSVIGIELPNENREKVILRKILSSKAFGDSSMSLPLALGKDIGGDPVVANLARMPHLLIAGTTGSGKSVAINTMILSLLYKLTPEECRMIMIDPKMLELSVYDGIPHLLSPVVTDPKKAVTALKWVVGEMEERYRKMSKMGVRNIEGFNGRVCEALEKGETFARTVQTGFDEETGQPVFETEETAPEMLPYIVVIVDEMADLMMVAGKEIEACIQRLAQMARASGIHLIMATQRPSVDVITGTIKANFPTRISFQVTSKVDSRTILGEMGAEQLLGMGDMLYLAGGAKIMRCHGPFVSDQEVEDVVNHLKACCSPDYVSGVVEGPDEQSESDIDLVLGLGGNTDGADALYDQAVQIVIDDRKCSTSYIQRKLSIGYNKAARLVEQMEDQGLVSAANHVGKREILIPEQ